MNTEKIAKYKKSLDNANIPANVKTKIEAEIKRLESLDAKQKEASEKKEEAPAPEKKVSAKRTPKATPSRTSKPKSTTRKKPTRTVMSVAKEIRKDGESWKEAQARAKKVMKSDATQVTKKVESELDKLNKLVKSKKELRGMSGKTNLLRDASRKALPSGRRVSKEGNVYYENRANRADRGTYGKYHLAKGGNLESKNYEIELFWIGLRGDERKIGKYVVSEKTLDELESQWAHTLSIDVIDETNEKPMTWYSLKKELYAKGKEKNLFAEGGYLTDPTFGDFQSVVFARGGSVRNEILHVNQNIYITSDEEPKPNDFYFDFENQKVKKCETGYYNKGSKKIILTTDQDLINDGVKAIDEEYSRGGSVRNERRHVNHSEDYEVRYARNKPSRTGYKGKRSFDGGGSVGGFDLAGHLDGTFNVGQNDGALSGVTGTQYSGLVGETGAMSSGEMFSRGGSVRNERKHVNHSEDYEVRYARNKPSRTGYKGKRSFSDGGDFQAGVYANGGGVNDDSPKIYVADLEAYNNGELVGEWFDLTDYDDADELEEAIQDLMKVWGTEEYAIHDAENIPRGMYSEYMGAKDFTELYEMINLAKENDLPLAVVQEIVSQYDTDAIDNFYGRYDSAVDFAEQLVDDIGIRSFTDFERYLIISDTDKRLLSQEMANNYVDDIKDEDEGERLIGEADLDLEEYQEADDDTREEMLKKAREIVYDRYYEEWETGLDDPYYFLVEEQGLYDADSFENANLVRIDYDALADALEFDYTFVSHDGEVYVFNIH